MVTRRSVVTTTVAGSAALAVAAARPAPSLARSQATPAATPGGGSTTVVLVHGAFADASSWAGVAGLLLDADVPVVAIATPLAGIAADAAYLASLLEVIPGPVLLVGHSYGGAVITNAAPMAANVVGLVYVAAFAPAEGEAALDVLGQFPPTGLSDALRPTTADAEHPAVVIDPAAYHEIFAADVDPALAAVAAVSQRPVAASGFVEPSGPAGWETLPTWYLVATQDQTLGVDAERFYAERTGGTVIEVDASHSVAVSQPAVVVDLVMEALASVG